MQILHGNLSNPAWSWGLWFLFKGTFSYYVKVEQKQIFEEGAAALPEARGERVWCGRVDGSGPIHRPGESAACPDLLSFPLSLGAMNHSPRSDTVKLCGCFPC